MRHEATTGILSAILILGMGVLVRYHPDAQLIGTAVVGGVILVLLLIPYVPTIELSHPSQSVIGIVVASIGAYELLVDSSPGTLPWLLLLGGIGIVLEDQYRRKKGRTGPDTE